MLWDGAGVTDIGSLHDETNTSGRAAETEPCIPASGSSASPLIVGAEEGVCAGALRLFGASD
jgi:hypothetical protein